MINKNNKIDFKNLFKNNWDRAKQLKEGEADLRSKFEAVYNCFENVSEHITANTIEKRYIDSLKTLKKNPIREAFELLYKKQNKEGSFLFYIKKLRSLQPIYSNETGHKFFMTKAEPFETFLTVLYVVRCNVRHGTKEYTERSDKVLESITQILYQLISEIYNILFHKEIREENRKKDVEERKSISRMIFWVDVKHWILVLIVLLFVFIFLFGGAFIESEDVGKYENCNWQYTPDNVVCY